MSNRFHEIEIGKKFKRDPQGNVYVKSSKGGAHFDGAYYPINSQALVELVEDEKSWEDLDFHTFDFTATQLAGVIEAIIERATNLKDTIDADRLRKGLYAAHRAKPIRLIALLNTCGLDFPTDVIFGVYRHYDPATDTMRNGWTAQHAEPKGLSIWEILAGLDTDD